MRIFFASSFPRNRLPEPFSPNADSSRSIRHRRAVSIIAADPLSAFNTARGIQTCYPRRSRRVCGVLLGHIPPGDIYKQPKYKRENEALEEKRNSTVMVRESNREESRTARTELRGITAEVYRPRKQKKPSGDGREEKKKESKERKGAKRCFSVSSAFLRGDLRNDLNIYNSPKPNPSRSRRYELLMPRGATVCRRTLPCIPDTCTLSSRYKDGQGPRHCTYGPIKRWSTAVKIK